MDFKFDFQNWENTLRIIYLILPGIIFFDTYRRFVEKPYPTKEIYIAKIIYASMFIFVLNTFVLFLWSLTPISLRFSIPDPLQIPLQAIVVPIATALVFVAADQRRWVNRLAEVVHIKTVDPSPSGWDYFFSQRESVFVIIGLKDGSRVAGFFGPSSMASSSPDTAAKDIYIEQVYLLPEEEGKPWSTVERSRGMLIPHSEIQFIEFRS